VLILERLVATIFRKHRNLSVMHRQHTHGRKSRGNWESSPLEFEVGHANVNCPPRFCRVSKFRAPDCLHYSARRGTGQKCRSEFTKACHFKRKKILFTARCSYASAVLGVVILSVRPSVRLSHACFVTNPKNGPAIFLHHTKEQSF